MTEGYTFAMRRSLPWIGVLVIAIAFATPAGVEAHAAQVAATESSHPPDAAERKRKAEAALDRVQHNNVGQGIVDATYYVELAANADPSRAIPTLESYFARTREAELRSEIASVLVSLGDEDPQFWTLIFTQGEAALGEDPPDPFEMGQDGKASLPCSSESMLNWAKSRNLSREDACKEAAAGIPQRIRPLAECGDRRVIPVLQAALKSRSHLIQMMAAHGLVLTGDRDAITLVIEAIEHTPQDQARDLADSLIESNDPRAESILHQYMPDVNFAEAHQFRAQRAEWRRPILAAR